VSLLSGPLELRDPAGRVLVDNAESFARRALDDELQSRSAHLNPVEYDDCLSFVIVTAWRLSGRYDPAKGAQTFSTYAYPQLRRSYTSWLRQRFGDTRYQHAAVCASRSTDPETGAPLRCDCARTAPAESIDQLEELGGLADFYRSIDTSVLTPDARETHSRIVGPMVFHGLTREQVADALGWPRRQVSKALTSWRDELVEKCLT
jgi:RNA polymerase sigma factor (sigma-70 family)